MLVGRLDLAEPAGRTTADHPGLADRLLAVLPGLDGRGCSAGGPDGFARPLRDGTDLGHLVAHVTRELSDRIGRPVAFGTTEPVADHAYRTVVVECPADEPSDSTVGERLLRLAVDLVTDAAAGRTPDLNGRLAAARDRHRRETLAPLPAAVVTAARERDIPVQRVGSLDLLRLGQGRYRRLVRGAMTDGTSAVGVELTHDRALTRELLADLALPVPPGGRATTAEEAVDLFAALGAPIAVVPRFGPPGGRVAGLRTAEDVRRAFAEAAGSRGEALVEHQPPGYDYRVLVVAGRVVTATRTGPDGEACDVTGDVHPDVDEACRRAAFAAGLVVAGIDLRLRDIAEPLNGSGGITALGSGDGLCLAGSPEHLRTAGRAIIDALYPAGALARIPTVAVAGHAGTTAPLLAHLMAEGGRRVGLSAAARLVLGDPTVDVAVLEVDAAGFRERGLEYDWADVGVVLAGASCPAGSIVAERVRDGGTLVLDADAGDPGLGEIIDGAAAGGDRTQVVLFGLDPANPLIRRHLLAGGCAYVRDAGWLTQMRDCYKVRVLPVDELPAGSAPDAGAAGRVAGALAAVAAATAHGLSPATIRRRISAFRSAPPAAASVVRIDAVAAPEPARAAPARYRTAA